MGAPTRAPPTPICSGSHDNADGPHLYRLKQHLGLTEAVAEIVGDRRRKLLGYIREVCSYCLISAVTSFLLLFATLWHLQVTRHATIK